MNSVRIVVIETRHPSHFILVRNIRLVASGTKHSWETKRLDDKEFMAGTAGSDLPPPVVIAAYPVIDNINTIAFDMHDAYST
jgi:hypothetical protein